MNVLTIVIEPLVMEHGRPMQCGETEAISAHPREAYT